MQHELTWTKGEDRPFSCQRCRQSWMRAPSSPCPGVHYYGWRQAPGYLSTYTQLRAKHFKPRDQGKPDGCLATPKGWIWLYDERQALPRRQCSERQRQALARAREHQRKQWKCEHCGDTPANLAELQRFFAMPGLCCDCKEQLAWQAKEERRAARIRRDRQEAIAWAQGMLARQDWAILDTETTSLTGYPVEIAVIAPDGSTLFASLVNPQCPIAPSTQAIHGITEEETSQAPTLPDLWSDLQKALAGRSLLLAYNAAFDEAVMRRSASSYHLTPLSQAWECLMLWYAQFVGDWSNYWGSYRWQTLQGGHRAGEDAQAALAVVHEMASGIIDEEE